MAEQEPKDQAKKDEPMSQADRDEAMRGMTRMSEHELNEHLKNRDK